MGFVDINTDRLAFNTVVTGPMYGAGLTLAGGYKSFFTTVNTMYITQFIKEANIEVEAMAITPLIGVRLPKIVNVVVGAQYQLYNSNVNGGLNLDGESLNYAVTLKTTRWNFIAGLQRDFSNHWNGTIMVGGAPRPQATAVLGYRF